MNPSGEEYKHWYPPPIGCFFSHGNNEKHPRHFLDVIEKVSCYLLPNKAKLCWKLTLLKLFLLHFVEMSVTESTE
jgi:hypothetical protein